MLLLLLLFFWGGGSGFSVTQQKKKTRRLRKCPYQKLWIFNKFCLRSILSKCCKLACYFDSFVTDNLAVYKYYWTKLYWGFFIVSLIWSWGFSMFCRCILLFFLRVTATNLLKSSHPQLFWNNTHIVPKQLPLKCLEKWKRSLFSKIISLSFVQCTYLYVCKIAVDGFCFLYNSDVWLKKTVSRETVFKTLFTHFDKLDLCPFKVTRNCPTVFSQCVDEKKYCYL